MFIVTEIMLNNNFITPSPTEIGLHCVPKCGPPATDGDNFVKT